MVDFGIGVATAGTYEIKKIDSDYFDETTRDMKPKPACMTLSLCHSDARTQCYGNSNVVNFGDWHASKDIR